MLTYELIWNINRFYEDVVENEYKINTDEKIIDKEFIIRGIQLLL